MTPPGAKMTSPGGKLTALASHPTKNENKAEKLTYLSLYKHWQQTLKHTPILNYSKNTVTALTGQPLRQKLTLILIIGPM